MRVGRLRQVVPSSLRFGFEIVARDTACAGAALELADVPLRLRCRGCGGEWEPELPSFRCPRCDGGDVEVLAGEELEIDYIDVEDPEEVAACTARG
jgi:hydrogenase nickel incorporation protein HypA/HybF